MSPPYNHHKFRFGLFFVPAKLSPAMIVEKIPGLFQNRELPSLVKPVECAQRKIGQTWGKPFWVSFPGKKSKLCVKPQYMKVKKFGKCVRKSQSASPNCVTDWYWNQGAFWHRGKSAFLKDWKKCLNFYPDFSS